MDSDYLQKEITDRARDGKVCFLFQVQFLDADKLRASKPASYFLNSLQKAGKEMNSDWLPKSDQSQWSVTDWVENGGLLWSEKDMPFYTVAKIEIPARTESISCDNQYINTRLHSNPENQPIGSIARVRTLVEEISRARRMKEIP